MGILAREGGRSNDSSEMVEESWKVSRTSFGISVGFGLLGDWVAGHDRNGELETRAVVVV